jgi:error-prone DNA polymerase
MKKQPEFVHLHVASALSMKFGTAPAERIPIAAAEHGHSVVALTDRDSVAGAVRFMRACEQVGVDAIIGVDMAVAPVLPESTIRAAHSATPVKGGRLVSHDMPRVVILARGGLGWTSLCKLVSLAHARGQSNDTTAHLFIDDICDVAQNDSVYVLLGAASETAYHLMRHRDDLAEQTLQPWRSIKRALFVEVVTHGTEPVSQPLLGQPDYSTRAGRRLLGFSYAQGLPAIISNAVRYLNRTDAPIADILERIRTLTVMHDRDATSGQAFYASTAQMRARARLLCEGTPISAEGLIKKTLELAQQCRITSQDLGLGVPRVPEIFGSNTHRELEQRCWSQFEMYASSISGMKIDYGIDRPTRESVRERLRHELSIIEHLGFAGYFLTVACIVDLVKARGIRVSARGSGAGSLVNHILGISAVDPMQHGLLMERFLSPLRSGLPDIDIDVESARRLEVYDLIVERFGRERTACVSMMETYRVRQAIRDVGLALGLPPGEVSAFATAFPHIRARDIRAALRDLPELQSSSFHQLLTQPRWQMLVECVERLDGLPRHRAMHPCGVILSDSTLLARTPVEPSRQGYPMSQFDKDDVEEMGFLKLDVLGVRMQSAMAHAVSEVQRTGDVVELDQVPYDDSETFALIQSTRTLGCFQIESPGQRELVGKLSPASMGDLIIDISLFRPGPVKSDMVTPFLDARHGDRMPDYIHPTLRAVLAETHGVVVFHEQVIRIVSVMTGCSLAYADEVRRGLGTVSGQESEREWFYRAAHAREYSLDVIDRVWEVLRAFASFGFCKAHAAAFAVPTYQSAWLKRHYPAAFYAGVLTHDPGMYPKRLILADARAFGIPLLPIDINVSDAVYRVEQDLSGVLGVRLPLSEVAGISDGQVQSTIQGRPYRNVIDVLYRAGLSQPVLESLIEIGACDSLSGSVMSPATEAEDPSKVITRRDMLLEVARHRPNRQSRNKSHQVSGPVATLFSDSHAAQALAPVKSYGLPEMTARERMQAELSVVSMDVSTHIMSFHAPFLAAIKATRSNYLLQCRSHQEVLVAGVKVAVQTPPVRSGRRVVFLTVDDGAGPIDLTFFEDVQRDYATTLFGSWLLLMRGHVRRTGPRGLSIRATGCWDLLEAEKTWRDGGVAAVHALLTPPTSSASPGDMDEAAAARAASRSLRPVLVHPSGFRQSPYADVKPAGTHLTSGLRASINDTPGI